MLYIIARIKSNRIAFIQAQVQRRVALQKDILLDKIANIRGAVVMAYPMGLPAQDLVKISLDHDSLEVSVSS